MSLFSVGRLILSTALVIYVAGCNSSNLVSVTGKVTYNDKPVPSGTISFIADDKPAAYGDLKPDGTYELHTVNPGDGATPGSYKVIVVAMADQEKLLPEQRASLPPPIIPIKYTALATTDLKAEVEKGKKNVIDFKLTGSLK